MPSNQNLPAETFGTVIGMAPGNVPVYSSDYDSADDDELPTRQSYRSYVDDIYMGHKWQCVEFARRWLYLNYGYVFDDIAMAYDIFRLSSVRVITDNRLLPLRSFRNGAKRWPEPGCLLIWDEGGEFEVTGHVAIVTEVTPDYVRIAEQNVGDRMWPAGQNYSRQIRAETGPDGHYWLECTFGNAQILGWVIQTDEDAHAERIVPADPGLFNLAMREVAPDDDTDADEPWLNIANADEAAYVEFMEGHLLNSTPANQRKYLCMSQTALTELRRATNELHSLFMHATNYVLSDDARLEKFNIPRALWPKIHQSWDNRRNQMITGRFDFTLSDRGLKVYEYNCDSASCHMETGKVQRKWAEHVGCSDGTDSGDKLQELLTGAWRHSDVDGIVHIMQDRDLEETYHALFMQDAMTRAGIESKIIHGVSGLHWLEDGGIADADGIRVNWVWKTWAWETALDQLRAEFEDSEVRVRQYGRNRIPDRPPRLVDVLLRPEVMVYEPLWTLIPSNKAILPVLWSMFPEYPYLLNSAYELTDEIRSSGYVVKPIVGRGGANISIFDRHETLKAETGGKFDDRNQIYQQLFALPKIDGYNVQIGTFTAAGRYAGACVRIDESDVINMESENLALRVVADKEFSPPEQRDQ